MIYVLASVILALVLIHVYIHHGRRGSILNRLPGPPTIPILGNLLSLQVPLVEIEKVLQGWCRTYFPLYRIWLGHKAVVMIVHPDDVEVVLSSSKQINKDIGYEHLRPWLKNGLLTSSVDIWSKHRKILTPTFHFNVLKKYMDITNEQGEKFCAQLCVGEKETDQELLPLCSRYTLNIISESAMGVALDNMNADVGMIKKYKDGVYKMGEITFYKLVRPYIQDWIFPLWRKLYLEQKEALHNLFTFTDKIVKERREYHQNTNYVHLNNVYGDDDDSINVYIGKKKRLAMLDLLLLAEKDGLIDDAGIKDEVTNFVFAGHDTTAMAMCFVILLLAENKSAQDRARNEVEEVFNRTDKKLEISDLQEMKYLERCIKESLRLFPSVPRISRVMTDDLQLKNGLAPKGSNVILHIVNTHRVPEFWPEPDKFDPDRFLPERVQGRHPYAYVPFSAGSRNCIGQKFAMMELKSLLARILYDFRLEPITHIRDIVMVSDVVIRPNHPVYTKFIKIDR